MTQTITFPAGTTRRSVIVNTLNDGISELTENFGAQLSNPNGAGLAFNVGSQATASADIVDNDRKFVRHKLMYILDPRHQKIVRSQ